MKASTYAEFRKAYQERSSSISDSELDAHFRSFTGEVRNYCGWAVYHHLTIGYVLDLRRYGGDYNPITCSPIGYRLAAFCRNSEIRRALS